MSVSVPDAVPSSDRARIARLVPRHSPSGAVLVALRAAMTPGWTPMAAAAELRRECGPDVHVLRRARQQLRAAVRDQPTLLEMRAIAALNLAIESDPSPPLPTPAAGPIVNGPREPG